MKALINLDGHVESCELTFYFPKSLSHEDGYNSDKACKDFDVDCMVRVNIGVQKCIIKMAASKDEEPFLFIHVKSPLAVVNPVCNVRVETIYTFNIFGWVAFGLVGLYRKLKPSKLLRQ